MSLAVKLRLLDVSATVASEDDAVQNARHLEKILQDLFHPSSRIRCESARECLCKMMVSRENDNSQRQKQQRQEFLQQVTRFVKTKDRYLALASLLLKSRAFFETYDEERIRSGINSNNNNCTARQKIVSLPRTQYKKPYIPTFTVGSSDKGEDAGTGTDPDEVNAFSISLSHQWPFAGLARIHHTSSHEVNPTAKKQQQSPLLVGFDIVTFDDYNPRLYNSVDEFIHVFRESFAPTEWQTILSQRSNKEAMLREFYLQWSVKEAYTKALGVGLGFDFQSFHVEWEDRNNKCISSGPGETAATRTRTRLWEVLKNSYCFGELADETMKDRQQTFVEMSGVIAKTVSPTDTSDDDPKMNPSRKERWKFLFLPLQQTPNERLLLLTRQNTMIGAGCACIGPFPAEDNDAKDYTNTTTGKIKNVEWEIEWTDLASMISYVQG